MPMAYTIDRDAGLVRIEAWGILTNEEVLGCIERLYSDPARFPGMRSLVDCRKVEGVRVTPMALQAAATLESILADPARVPWASAVVAPLEEMYRAACTFEALRAGSPQKVRVFRDAVEAEGWLQHQ